MAEQNDRYLVPGLLRGLNLLHCFTPETPNLSLSEISRKMGISRSAAFRSVYTLDHMGCLLHDSRSNSYSLGPAVLGLGHGYVPNREIVEIAQPVWKPCAIP